ncbi:Pentatricopeptide repeat-containing protein [Apostasia shenzhenica]|uniref:Pentatricopeptide repeat-containing protein n=1 Tax=Apostasia shenzhenica TaxID=1088818 RepID=A0A2I0A7X7_9ASPA|nr:Pentatricopeptide repeat-containing protein [Apostasia shenzhenica]
MAAAAAAHLAVASRPSSLSRKNSDKTKNPGSSVFHSSQRILLCTPSSSVSLRSAQIAATSPIEERRVDLDEQTQELCQKGDLELAMKSISSLTHENSSSLGAETFCYLLQLCAELRSLSHGKKLHSIISSSGIAIDSEVGSQLVFMYVKCGELGEGRRAFDRLPSRDHPFPWSLLMSKYADIGEFDESISLFIKMWESGTKPNSHTFSCILKCLAAIGSIRLGMTVHGYLQKLDLFRRSVAVGNAIIAFYSKCSSMNVARKVFDEMPLKDIVTWNSMIHGYVSNGFAKAACEFFTEMWASGMEIDLATMVSVIPACSKMGFLAEGQALHGHSIKSGFVKEVSLNNTLVDMYSKCRNVDNATQVFDKMGEKNIVSWTTMTSGFTINGAYQKAIALFEEMEAEGVELDLHFITSALHCCACSGSLNQGKHIHDYVVRNGLESNVFVANSLMDMYAKCGNMVDARLVFDCTSIKDIISWNTLIGGYSKNSLPNEALALFAKMQQHYKPNTITMACTLRASASLSALDKGREIHAHVVRSGYQECSFVANALVDMYAKCGALLLARRLFERIAVKDIFSWTVMIAGYGMHGHGREALATFKEMRGKGIKPDGVSFIALLYSCSHSGLVDEGWRFFNMMRNEFKIDPAVEHYACMVDLLSRAGRLSKAFKFIESMPIKPDATVWGALLCGCRSHRNVELAEKVAERVFELEPENTGYYILLANIYAEAEKWEAVKKLRQRIGFSGLKKNPGCSWIEIKSQVHIFVAGGKKSNLQSKEIESFLDGARRRMKEEGYAPRLRYALIKAEDEVKEEALCGHSEKLAIAFGILNTSEGKPIRVAKNLRVCGDCHEVAKFISYMTGREIILRDSNRFHHFQQGRCSCRGYW